jgi:hypothetical protein
MGAPLGNQYAKKAKVWEHALKRALARYSGSTIEAGLDKIADRMVKAAAEGDESAFASIAEKIGDRLDGKPAQAIIGGGEDDPPLTHKIIREVIKP